MPKWTTFLLIVLTLSPTSAISSQTSVLELVSAEACKVELTSSGKTAAFSGTAVYRVVIGANGKVATINSVVVPEFFTSFLRLDQFETCVRRWKFTGAGESTFSFFVGTTGEALKEWQITVTLGGKKLSLALPR